jgi:acyl-CoA thioester hydrolase
MFTNEISLRVRYSETDKMGYVYYGNYAAYFEVARVETLRKLGVSYRQLEEDGLLLPVLEYTIKYLKPAFYDDELRIETCITEWPQTRIFFSYKTYRGKELLNEAKTSLVFVNKESGRPTKCPESILSKLQPAFGG